MGLTQDTESTARLRGRGKTARREDEVEEFSGAMWTRRWAIEAQIEGVVRTHLQRFNTRKMSAYLHMGGLARRLACPCQKRINEGGGVGRRA